MPYETLFSLFASCFTGKLPKRINRLQKVFQSKAARLFEKDAPYHQNTLTSLIEEAHLCADVLLHLSRSIEGKAESSERLNDTLESIYLNFGELNLALQESAPELYKKFQNLRDSILGNELDKFFREIYLLTSRLHSTVARFPEIGQSLTEGTYFLDSSSHEYSRLLVESALSFNLAKVFRVLYSIYLGSKRHAGINNDEDTKNEQISLLSSQFDDLLGRLGASQKRIEQLKNELANLFENLQTQKRGYVEEIDSIQKSHSRQISGAEQLVKGLKSELDQSKQNVGRAELQRVEAEERLERIQEEQSRLSNSNAKRTREIATFRSENEKLQAQKHQLQKDLSTYKAVRNILNSDYSQNRLTGNYYIGNVSNPKSKYHFKKDCPIWRSLTLEYITDIVVGDGSRNVKRSSNRMFFEG